MAQLTNEMLNHIADQSRLYLKDEEAAGYLDELNDKLTYIEKVNELNTDGVTPTTNGNQNKNVLRKDQAIKWDQRDEALDHAPEHDGAHFKVPAIMD